MLPIVLVHVQEANTSQNLLNEIRQIMCSLYSAKEISKQVCENIMNLIKL